VKEFTCRSESSSFHLTNSEAVFILIITDIFAADLKLYIHLVKMCIYHTEKYIDELYFVIFGAE
jgi:hypothetical protein